VDESELIRKFFATAFPNPDRVGCPDGRVLWAIAKNTLPADDPARLHLASCSPCFTEVQEAKRQIQNELARRKSRVLGVAAAVTLAIGAVAGAILWSARDHDAKSEPTARAPTEKRATPGETPQKREDAKASTATPYEIALDLRPWSRTRGSEEEDVKRPSLRVPARLVKARLTLPIGSDDGMYDLEIRPDFQAEALRTARGNATIRNGETRLEVEFDLSAIPVGKYTLLYRHADASWHDVPIVIY
jgi:hypothetical protein